jgi:hypothetical protein
MLKILQNNVDRNSGDCMRAVIASLLELNIQEVPNFIEYNERCYTVLMQFLLDRNYHPCFIYKHNYRTEQLIEIANICGGINGYFFASVPSQTYEDGSHAVVVDKNLNVIHDPNPNQKCLKLKPEDVTMIMVVGDFIIPEHIKMRHEISNSNV